MTHTQSSIYRNTHLYIDSHKKTTHTDSCIYTHIDTDISIDSDRQTHIHIFGGYLIIYTKDLCKV